MKPNDYNTTFSTVIDESASLQVFYSLTNTLSKNRRVRFIDKMDEADLIEWNFKYKGSPLSLQYDIYGGVSLTLHNSKYIKVANELADKLKAVAQ